MVSPPGTVRANSPFGATARCSGPPANADHLETRSSSARRPGGDPRTTRHSPMVNAGWSLVLSLAVMGSAVGPLVGGASEVQGLAVLIASGTQR